MRKRFCPIPFATTAGIAAVILTLAGPARTQSAPPQEQNPLGAVGKWFEETFSFLGSGLKNAKGNIDNFNREAEMAAKTAGGAAKDAADTLARMPGARVVRGRSDCTMAPNGAPDCVAAASRLCKSNGFATGTSIDMTTAEECPVPVMLGRRAAQPGECKPVTFITRALCQ
ncbi:MAG: hypothetical protein JOZ70_12195 [Pseudolabrys sp.]|nr:hypothetical protein [Pseudolabrys sp.]MBV9955997.1 hypothetical protein [Pseudolabrys sp.]